MQVSSSSLSCSCAQLLKSILHNQTRRSLHGRRKPINPVSRTATARRHPHPCLDRTNVQACVFHLVVVSQTVCAIPRNLFWVECPTPGWVMSSFATMTACHSAFPLPIVCPFPDWPLPLVPSFAACHPSPSAMPFVFPSLPFTLRSAAIVCNVTQASTSIAMISSSNSANVLVFHTRL